MKKQLLIAGALLLSSSVFSQLSNGLVSQFYFTGGTLQNLVGTSSLVLSEEGDGATYSSDRNGNSNNALSFDGSAGNVQKLSIDGANLEFDLSADFSISFWFKTDNIAAADLQILFSSRQDLSPGEKGGVDCYINGNGEFEVVYRQVSNGAPINGLNNAKVTTINSGTWYHVVITKSGANVSHYINNSQVSTETITNYPTNNFPVVSYWNVGAFNSTQTGLIYRELDGGLDDLRLYNRALSVQEVGDLFQENTPVASIKELGTVIKIYPNPIQDVLTISSEELVKEVTIVSTDGKMVYSGLTQNNIDISSLQSGVYIVKCTLENNQVMTKRVVKN